MAELDLNEIVPRPRREPEPKHVATSDRGAGQSGPAFDFSKKKAPPSRAQPRQRDGAAGRVVPVR